jgi:hypothetical protein
MITFEALTPSATWFIDAMISSIDLPEPSSSPTWRFRLRWLVQVTMRSPMPASPANVSRCPPRASPIFDISRTARAITIARVFSPIPSE